jgi:hypothetical protein
MRRSGGSNAAGNLLAKLPNPGHQSAAAHLQRGDGLLELAHQAQDALAKLVQAIEAMPA